MDVFDIAIIGCGPAGCAAACQAYRYHYKLIIISDEPPGGLLRAARQILNLPGFSSPPDGIEFADLLCRQLDALNMHVHSAQVSMIDTSHGCFSIFSSQEQLCSARSVILCTGTNPKPYCLPGLPEVQSHGRFHRDIRTLPMNLNSQRIAVIGGGEAAVDTALNASSRGAQVSLISRHPLHLENMNLVEAIHASDLIQIADADVVKIDITSDGTLILHISAKDRTFTLPFEHMIVCIGREPRWELLRTFGFTSSLRSISTGIDGLYLAGDLIHGTDRYAGIAFGDGIQAVEAVRAFFRAPRESSGMNEVGNVERGYPRFDEKKCKEGCGDGM